MRNDCFQFKYYEKDEDISENKLDGSIMFSILLQLTPIIFIEACLYVGTGGLRAPCVAWPLLLPSFSLSFFLSFSPLRLLLLTHFGESPVCENLLPPIFWPNKKEYLKKEKIQVIFIFLRKKTDYLAIFLLFTASVFLSLF